MTREKQIKRKENLLNDASSEHPRWNVTPWHDGTQLMPLLGPASMPASKSVPRLSVPAHTARTAGAG